MAAAKSPAGIRPSIHSVAAYAGVSIATVSKVMHGDKTVRAENVTSVQNAIEALGYRLNPLAADLRRGRRKLIGVIVPAYDDPFYASLIGVLEKQAEARGYALAATSSRGSETRELELIGRMEDWRVSGVVLVPVKNENSPGARALVDTEMAAVFVSNVVGGSGMDTVSLDYDAAIRDIAARTLELGHRRILIPVQDAKNQMQMRLASRLADDLKRLDAGVTAQILRSSPRPEKLGEALAEVFGAEDRPTVVLSFCEIAIACSLNIARRLGWRVPDDLSLFSFEGAAWMQALEPAIGGVQRPLEAFAAAITDTLFLKIDKKVVDHRDRHLPCKLDFGRSMAKALDANGADVTRDPHDHARHRGSEPEAGWKSSAAPPGRT